MGAISAELQKLADLVERGVISNEEFAQAKKRVLRGTAAEEAARQVHTPNAPREVSSRQQNPHVGEHLGAYLLLERLGVGGMASVYRARHTSRTISAKQGGDVAIKMLHPHLAHKAACRRRFKREAEIGSRLNHPHIVRVHDLIADGDCWALVLDLVHGPLFTDIMEQYHEGLPMHLIVRYFDQLLDGVEAAHRAGIVHRDLKPDNVLVRSSDDTLHLVDFGIATSDQLTRNTRVGARMGTYGYGAPEQFTDARTADARSDIYALGVMLFEMSTGKLPWPGAGDVRELLARQLQGVPNLQACDSRLVPALRGMLQPEPGERPATIETVRVLLANTDQTEVRAKYYDRPRWREDGSADEDTQSWAAQLATGGLPDVVDEPSELVDINIIRAKEREVLAVPPAPRWKKGVVAVGVVAVGALAGAWLGAERTTQHLFPASGDSAQLVVATGRLNPPLYWRANERVVGFDADLARALAGQLGKTSVRFIQDPSPLDIVQRGEADLALAGLPIQSGDVLYSNSYLEVPMVVVTRPDLSRSVARAGARLEGLTCSASDPVATRLLKETWCQWVAPGSVATADALSLGHVEVTVMPRLLAAQHEELSFSHVELGTVQYGVAAQDGNNALRSRVDAGLEELESIGGLKRLMKRYKL